MGSSHLSVVGAAALWLMLLGNSRADSYERYITGTPATYGGWLHVPAYGIRWLSRMFGVPFETVLEDTIRSAPDLPPPIKAIVAREGLDRPPISYVLALEKIDETFRVVNLHVPDKWILWLRQYYPVSGSDPSSAVERDLVTVRQHGPVLNVATVLLSRASSKSYFPDRYTVPSAAWESSGLRIIWALRAGFRCEHATVLAQALDYPEIAYAAVEDLINDCGLHRTQGIAIGFLRTAQSTDPVLRARAIHQLSVLPWDGTDHTHELARALVAAIDHAFTELDSDHGSLLLDIRNLLLRHAHLNLKDAVQDLAGPSIQKPWQRALQSLLQDVEQNLQQPVHADPDSSPVGNDRLYESPPTY